MHQERMQWILLFIYLLEHRIIIVVGKDTILERLKIIESVSTWLCLFDSSGIWDPHWILWFGFWDFIPLCLVLCLVLVLLVCNTWLGSIPSSYYHTYSFVYIFLHRSSKYLMDVGDYLYCYMVYGVMMTWSIFTLSLIFSLNS